MNVSEAVQSRRSIRAFLDKPIDIQIIKNLLEQSSRSPSGGNLQPWKVYVLNESSIKKFLDFQMTWSKSEALEYEIYPPKLKEPYRTYRYDLGEDMYTLLGIEREDKESRIKQVMKNFEFFNAPCALFCFIDKQMGPPQWSDLGMFLQTFMLLAQEQGIDTCAQEAWSMKHGCVKEFVHAGDDLMLFCGMSIGFRDPDAKINQLQSQRSPISDWAKFL
jgi:nitroreductase